MKKKISGNNFGAVSKIKNMLTSRRALLGAALVVFGLAAIFWQNTSLAEQNEQNIWQPTEKSAIVNRVTGLPDDFQTLRLDKQRLAAMLSDAPHESRVPLRNSEAVLQLPMPDGTFSRFRVQEAPILEESLQVQFPDIKSYRVVSIDNSGTTGRFDVSPRGFYATILSPDKTVSIMPADRDDESLYVSYDGAGMPMERDENAMCSVGEDNVSDEFKEKVLSMASPSSTPVTAVPILSKLRTYQIAISTTNEFSADTEIGGGNDYDRTIASINTWMNGVNAIYERELSIRLKVVANRQTIFTTTQDQFTDTEATPHGGVNFPIIRKLFKDNVGSSNYNLGHLFRRNRGGGVAGLGIVCDNNDAFVNGQPDGNGPIKGNGETGLSVDRLGSLKVLAHEIGHQFGAKHTFNGNQASCAGRTPDSAYEVGSGNSIMSYHNLCRTNDIITDNIIGEASATVRFHTHSFTQITNHVYNNTPAMTCGIDVDINNSPPIVTPLLNTFRIPKFTPFTLKANATDPDVSDQTNLTYAWEQYQTGDTQFSQNGTEASYNDLLDAISTTRPIFRPVPATTSPSRTFPSLKYILNNANDPPHKEGDLITGEELPRIGRTLNFRVTVHDQLGGTAYQNMTVAVEGNAGPFKVNEPNTAVEWTGGTQQTVRWNVAGTNANGINATQVKILLSTDGGQTFPTVLFNSAPNFPDGSGVASASVNVPNGINTTTARIKIQPTEYEDIVWFDISDANFTIKPSTTGNACPIISDIEPKVAVAGSTVIIKGANLNGVTSVVFSGGATIANPPVNTEGTEITVTVPATAQGGEITVNKANSSCNAVKSSRFTLCSGTPSTEAVDDGSVNNFGFAFEGTNYIVNRITPKSYPATLSEVSIYHRAGVDGFPMNKDITILSAAHPSGNTNIDNTTFNSKPGKITQQGSYVVYKVDPITIQSGDFIVGYSFTRAATGEPIFPVPQDKTLPHNNRSYRSTDGMLFGNPVAPADPTTEATNFMIRATVFSNPATQIEPLDDATNSNYSAAVGTTYIVNRITPDSYPATLTEVSIYHSSTSFPTNKPINIISAAHPVGDSNINNTRFNTQAATVRAHEQFVVYKIAPITIHNGDFIIGYSFDRGGNEAPFPNAVDTSPRLTGRAYWSTNGKDFNSIPDIAYRIRGATASASPCSNGACTYSVAPTNGTIPVLGGPGGISIITQPQCEWKASRNVAWITITSPTQQNGEIKGSGNRTINFTVAPHDGTARVGGLTVLGRVMSIVQTFNLGEDPTEPEIYELQDVPFIAQEELVPTSATVSIGGRVSTLAGIGVRGAVVSLVTQTGQTRTIRTNAFGYYRFDEVEVGETVVLNAASKRYLFAPRVITIEDAVETLDFVPLE